MPLTSAFWRLRQADCHHLRAVRATKWVPSQLELQSKKSSLTKQEDTERQRWGEICIYFIYVILVSMLFHKDNIASTLKLIYISFITLVFLLFANFCLILSYLPQIVPCNLSHIQRKRKNSKVIHIFSAADSADFLRIKLFYRNLTKSPKSPIFLADCNLKGAWLWKKNQLIHWSECCISQFLSLRAYSFMPKHKPVSINFTAFHSACCILYPKPWTLSPSSHKTGYDTTHLQLQYL